MNSLDKVLEKEFLKKEISFEKDISSIINRISIFTTEEILLSVIIQSIKKYVDKDNLWINMEGHGREEFDRMIDLSKTVGWFTTIYPVNFKIHNNILDTLLDCRYSIEKIPNKGFDYQLVKDPNLSNDPDISFNYLGKFNPIEDYENDIKKIRYSIVESFPKYDFGLENHRIHQIEFVPIIKDMNLFINIFYNSKMFNSNIIDDISLQIKNNLKYLLKQINEYKDILNYLRIINENKNSIRLKFDEYLDLLQNTNINNVDSILDTTGLQNSMLLESLKNKNSGDYIVQWYCDLDENVDINKFIKTWKDVVNEYDILKSSFKLIGDKFYQIIHKKIELSYTELDWYDEKNIEEKTTEFLKKIRHETIDISNPSLIKIYIVRSNKKDIFIFQYHHALLDGWGTKNLIEKFNKLYNSDNKFHPKDINSQFSRYINFINKIKSERDIDKWVDYLNDINEPTLIAGYKSRRSLYETYKLSLEENIVYKIKQYCVNNKITTNTFMQFVVGMLLKLFTGNNDILFGSTLSGRNIELNYVENIVGALINTLPVRIDFKKHDDIDILLKEIQENQLNTEMESFYSINELSEKLKLDIGKLFDVLYVYENYPNKPEISYPLDLSTMKGKEQINYPLGIAVEEQGKNITINFVHNKCALDKEYIKSMANTINSIIGEIFENTSIRNIEKNVFMKILPYYKNKSIVQSRNMDILINEMFDKYKKEIAIVKDNVNYRYEYINEVIKQLEDKIDDKNQNILVSTEDKILQICSMLYAFKNNSTYIPLDKNTPSARVNKVKEDLKNYIIITGSHEEYHIEYKKDKVGQNHINETAYIIFTSGTTGEPKGVKVTYNNLEGKIYSLNNIYGICSTDKIYQNISFSFDPSITEVLLPLINGATIYLSNERLLGNELENYLIKNKINSLTITPTLLLELNLDKVETLDKLYVGGEKFEIELYKKINPQIRVLNLYGPTEATITSTYLDVSKYVLNGYEKSIPIGKPLDDTYVYVLNKYGKLTPPMTEGELFLGGNSISSGYIEDYKLTKSKFVPNKIDNRCNILYKTGDIVRVNLDGNLEYLRRNDSQVKIRGFRIDIEDIKTISKTLKKVMYVECLLERISDLNELILVYYGECTEEDILSILKEKLPQYMIPSRIYKLPSIPLNSRGKIDMSAIKNFIKLKIDNIQELTNSTNKKDETDKILQNIWKDILLVSEVDYEDDFFELGGNSILAIRLNNKIKKIMNIEISISDIFKFTTFSEQVEFIKKIKGGVI
ncbi:TPA: condensation domain-containing protein [Streptococcus pyogenes]